MPASEKDISIGDLVWFYMAGSWTDTVGIAVPIEKSKPWYETHVKVRSLNGKEHIWDLEKS